MVKKIVIFASGEGTNTENICNYFSTSTRFEVVLIATNKKDSFVINRAQKLNIPSFVFSKNDLNNSVIVEKKLLELEVDFIVLAGFLLKVPKKIINLYSDKIVNIHPSLLPKFGGKGMFGENVHQSVIESGEKESGITIHYVNNNYDEGGVILQEKCSVSEDETIESLSEKIQKLEHEFFPKTIEKIILK
ncbi:MAG: phosphoribosylglycinamide formyltransferase [Flavobacteriales bacterium]|jgi:phosphoribosylglycinamide formyltransferase-1|nr:phosphoribosylglycinamide formyltransferase [Flavobacteriales bacterium]